MNYTQVLIEECKDLMKLLKTGKISKYDVANTVIDISTLIEAKETNLQVLKERFKVAESNDDKEQIQDAVMNQWKEKIELENLVCILSADLERFMPKKNNIIHF